MPVLPKRLPRYPCSAPFCRPFRPKLTKTHHLHQSVLIHDRAAAAGLLKSSSCQTDRRGVAYPRVSVRIMAKPTVPVMEPVTGTASATSNNTPDAVQEDVAKERSDKQRPRYIGAIDQGTTSTRFIIFDNEGQLVASHQTELRAIHAHSG
jgi:hypothetical protein